MIIHQLKPMDTMNVRIGIPGSLKISTTSEQPKITVQFSSYDESRIILNVVENNQNVEILLSDRLRGSNSSIHSDIEIALPQNLLDSLKIKAVCSNMSIGPVSINKLKIHNIKGKLEILPESHIRNLKLILVESEAAVVISNDIDRAFVKAIQCDTTLKTNGFHGSIDINIVGARANINDMSIQNGHFVLGEINKNNKLLCEVISGRFSLDQR
jgi:hypothetical protein